MEQNDSSQSIEKLKKKRVPKGTSAYQAAWIIDEEESDSGIEDDNEEDDTQMQMYDGSDHELDNECNVSSEDEYEDIELENRNVALDVLDEDEEKKQ